VTTVIRIENLSKRYIIGHQRREGYTTLRDVLMHKLRGMGQRIRHPLSANAENTQLEEFWALKDINLEIAEGECVGIIGRNGAGKSTLLKVLSRITEPTAGRVKMRGRIASLLEVGTGFHPELSGRENIYLNGAVLGMTRPEIKRKFDEIIAFAEVEKFLDTPVKRYSSGMYVRLAFAVAAHLEPEILIVDEVLAVGDAEFQKKCLGKMGDVTRGGRTVLFVSHNMGAVQSLAGRAVLLRDGQVSFTGPVADAIGHYLQREGLHHCVEARKLMSQVEGFSIESVRFEGARKEKGFNKPLYTVLSLQLEKTVHKVSFGFGFVNSIGSRVLTAERTVPLIERGRQSIEFVLHDHHLPPGDYSITLGIGVGATQALYQDHAIAFHLPYDGVDSEYLARKTDRIGVYHEPDYRILT